MAVLILTTIAIAFAAELRVGRRRYPWLPPSSRRRPTIRHHALRN